MIFLKNGSPEDQKRYVETVLEQHKEWRSIIDKDMSEMVEKYNIRTPLGLAFAKAYTEKFSGDTGEYIEINATMHGIHSSLAGTQTFPESFEIDYEEYEKILKEVNFYYSSIVWDCRYSYNEFIRMIQPPQEQLNDFIELLESDYDEEKSMEIIKIMRENIRKNNSGNIIYLREYYPKTYMNFYDTRKKKPIGEHSIMALLGYRYDESYDIHKPEEELSIKKYANIEEYRKDIIPPKKGQNE